MKATKQKSGSWRCRVYLGKDENGKHIYKSVTAPTKKEAEFQASQLLIEGKIAKNHTTLGQACEKYIERKDAVLSPCTIAGYRKIMRNYWHELQNTPIEDITVDRIQNEVNNLSKDLSPKTVRNVWFFFATVLHYEGCNINFNQITLPQKVKKIKELPTPQVIMDAVKGYEIELAILLGLLGFRTSEILALKRSDLRDGYITVTSVKVMVDGQYIEKSNAKTTNSNRKVKLPSYVLELIDQLPADQEYLVRFTGAALYSRFRRLLEAKNIEHISIHDLRHMSATMMATMMPNRIAMERGGWSTDQVLQSVYQHTFREDREKYDEIFNTTFDEMAKSRI